MNSRADGPKCKRLKADLGLNKYVILGLNLAKQKLAELSQTDAGQTEQNLIKQRLN